MWMWMDKEEHSPSTVTYPAIWDKHQLPPEQGHLVVSSINSNIKTLSFSNGN